MIDHEYFCVGVGLIYVVEVSDEGEKVVSDFVGEEAFKAGEAKEDVVEGAVCGIVDADNFAVADESADESGGFLCKF